MLPAVPRIVAIGDLHGDLGKARRAFRLGGLIDEDDSWIGGTTTAVQVPSPVPVSKLTLWHIGDIADQLQRLACWSSHTRTLLCSTTRFLEWLQNAALGMQNVA